MNGYATQPVLLMVSNDAGVAKVEYCIDSLGSTYSFTGSGTSKRERGDTPDPITGEALAVARAYAELAARLNKFAQSRIRAQDAERRQRRKRRTKEQWEQFKRNARLAKNPNYRQPVTPEFKPTVYYPAINTRAWYKEDTED